MSTAQLEAVAAVFCPAAATETPRRDLVCMAINGPGGLGELFGGAVVFRVSDTDGYY